MISFSKYSTMFVLNDEGAIIEPSIAVRKRRNFLLLKFFVPEMRTRMASNNELTLTIKTNSSSAEAAFSRMIAAVNKLADQADKSTSNASNGFSKLSTTVMLLL